MRGENRALEAQTVAWRRRLQAITEPDYRAEKIGDIVNEARIHVWGRVHVTVLVFITVAWTLESRCENADREVLMVLVGFLITYDCTLVRISLLHMITQLDGFVLVTASMMETTNYSLLKKEGLIYCIFFACFYYSNTVFPHTLICAIVNKVVLHCTYKD